MALTFGAGMPILFPIALISYLVIYIFERILLAYYYRQPELTDHTLANTAVHMLLIAPLCYLSVGFWMMNNIQIFQNDVKYTERYDDHYSTGHSIQSAIWPPHITQAIPLLLAWSILVVVIFTHSGW